MSQDNLPDDPNLQYMLKWIADKYSMKKSQLARMFQTTPSTIHYWFSNGKVSYKNYKKIRTSFYYLNNAKDPHAGERKCTYCHKWLPISNFRPGKSICKTCEKKRLLEHYHNNISKNGGGGS